MGTSHHPEFRLHSDILEGGGRDGAIPVLRHSINVTGFWGEGSVMSGGTTGAPSVAISDPDHVI